MSDSQIDLPEGTCGDLGLSGKKLPLLWHLIASAIAFWAWWIGTFQLEWLFLCFWIIGINPRFITVTMLTRKFWSSVVRKWSYDSKACDATLVIRQQQWNKLCQHFYVYTNHWWGWVGTSHMICWLH
jgi:hypothetical protein